MKKYVKIIFVITSLFMTSSAWSSESEAIDACKDKIRSIYAVDRFKYVEADKTGHNKYDVHGKVKYDGNRQPFSCRVKRGYVNSYHYSGPHKDHGDDKNRDRNIAIGVGLAAVVAAVAIANKNKNKNKDSEDYSNHVNKLDLEDDCHDAVSRRIKDNYHSVRRVNFKHDTISHNNRKSTGDGRAVYYDGHRTSFDFSCEFNRNGRVIDSSYSIY